MMTSIAKKKLPDSKSLRPEWIVPLVAGKYHDMVALVPISKVDADVILGSYWFHCWCDNKKKTGVMTTTKTLIALCQSR